MRLPGGHRLSPRDLADMRASGVRPAAASRADTRAVRGRRGGATVRRAMRPERRPVRNALHMSSAGPSRSRRSCVAPGPCVAGGSGAPRRLGRSSEKPSTGGFSDPPHPEGVREQMSGGSVEAVSRNLGTATCAVRGFGTATGSCVALGHRDGRRGGTARRDRFIPTASEIDRTPCVSRMSGRGWRTKTGQHRGPLV